MIPRDGKQWMNKKSEWKKMRYATSRERIKELDEKIRNADKEIMKSYRREETLNRESNTKHETKPISIILIYEKKENKKSLCPLKWEKNMSDPKKISKMLIDQYR